MYTRNYTRVKRYSPPPGYAGNAFVGEGEIKHHLPKDEVAYLPREEEIPPTEPVQKDKNLPIRFGDRDRTALSELLNIFRGKFGAEELVILAVMLLIAEDGIGPEVLILALTLIAG